MAAQRDPDGGWVLAGGEPAPVESLGPELHGEPATEEPRDRHAAPGAATEPPVEGSEENPEPAKDEEEGPEPVKDEEEKEEEEEQVEEGPEPVGEGEAAAPTPDGASPAACAAAGPGPDVPKAAPAAEEGSGTSSEEEREGPRRRRQGREPPPTAAPAAAPRWGAPRAAGDDEGPGGSKYLLGALALLALGLLLIPGGIYDPAEGESGGSGVAPPGTTGDTEVAARSSPGPAESVVPRDVAGEQQELPVPAGVTEPPPPEAGPPPSLQSMSLLLDRLAKENQDIRLMQAELQAHKEELQALLRRSEDEAAAAGAQRRGLEAENERLRAALEQEAAALRAARADLQRLRAPPGPAPAPASLAAARGELAGALERARASGDLERLLEELGGLERRLEQAEAAEPWKKPFKADNKEGKRHKRHEGAEKREQGTAHGPGKEPRPPREHKAWPEAPAQPGPAEPPLLSRYRAPRGCSGVAECARKEGMEPVQRAQFLQLLQGFLERLGWGGHLAGVAARLDGAFGPDGTFAHDRLRFVDFVDDAEELLEELARREGGDEEAADGFEEFVLQRVARGFAKKERPRKGPQQHRGGGPAWGHESRSWG